MIPKPIITQTSKIWLCNAKVPTTQKTKMTGIMYFARHEHQLGDIGDAADHDDEHQDLGDQHRDDDAVDHIRIGMEQQGSGLQIVDQEGTDQKASVTLPGIPMVTSGIRAPPMVALLAHSEATMPSSKPVPNFSGVFDMFLAVV